MIGQKSLDRVYFNERGRRIAIYKAKDRAITVLGKKTSKALGGGTASGRTGSKKLNIYQRIAGGRR